MATDEIRTVSAEVEAAVAALDAATEHLGYWRDHLLRIPAEADDAPVIVEQARRSAKIVLALVHEGQQHTEGAGRAHAVRLRSVS